MQIVFNALQLQMEYQPVHPASNPLFSYAVTHMPLSIVNRCKVLPTNQTGNACTTLILFDSVVEDESGCFSNLTSNLLVLHMHCFLWKIWKRTSTDSVYHCTVQSFTRLQV